MEEDNRIIWSQDVYGEDFKTMNKEIVAATRSCRDLLCPWTGIINIVKITILPKEVYLFNRIPTKTAMQFFAEVKRKQS